ncbi:hypothetical protein E2C01_052243 [Portunus trituberculatus]|uniref:Uncharacterized protein n=1 Tax=Portunus trituberculatus TaxID=210409 RepID=A0A5B7GLZ4_PORTR|nr:hypothetical protein [Portunus trituberculatus]
MEAKVEEVKEEVTRLCRFLKKQPVGVWEQPECPESAGQSHANTYSESAKLGFYNYAGGRVQSEKSLREHGDVVRRDGDDLGCTLLVQHSINNAESSGEELLQTTSKIKVTWQWRMEATQRQSARNRRCGLAALLEVQTEEAKYQVATRARIGPNTGQSMPINVSVRYHVTLRTEQKRTLFKGVRLCGRTHMERSPSVRATENA